MSMPISLSCPVSGQQRDNTTVRVVAAEALLVAVAAVVAAWLAGPAPAAAISALLAADFFIRALVKPRFSPLATVARGITSSLNLPKVMVDSAPKVFAARIGLAFAVAATILFALGLLVPGVITLAVLVVFAFLESAFSLCAGCWVYSLLPSRLGQALAREFRVDRRETSPTQP
jgi:hypothetical protein